AETGYNVGFGAKKNFATYDIVQKAPGLIGFASLVVGVFALICEPLNSKWIAATLVVFGIASLYVTVKIAKPVEQSREPLTLVTEGRLVVVVLCDVQATGENDDLSAYRMYLDAIQSEVFSSNQSKQILFSDWYAHYK
ncbi:SLATT domain-containing protein, partial [Serratia marcescens]|uniref:SLATT domain-containing protein n=1 Tax=Serratia marcescens TaxID=615 RepID=UPI001BCBA85D